MFVKIKDSKSKKIYYLEWSTINDKPNSEAVDVDGFVELHNKLRRKNFKTSAEWAMAFAKDRIQLTKTNVSNPEYTLGELLECSNEYKTKKSLVEYCKANYVKM